MSDTYTPPEGVQNAAKRALEWMKQGKAGGGFTPVGRKRASDLAAGRSVSLKTLKRMHSYFARHEPDKKADGFAAGGDGYPSPGRVAWDAWGGDAGAAWSRKMVGVNKMERAEQINEIIAKYNPNHGAGGRFASGGKGGGGVPKGVHPKTHAKLATAGYKVASHGHSRTMYAAAGSAHNITVHHGRQGRGVFSTSARNGTMKKTHNSIAAAIEHSQSMTGRNRRVMYPKPR